MGKADQLSPAAWPAEGLPAIEAVKRIVGAELWEAYREARKASRNIFLRVAGSREYTPDEQARLDRRNATYKAATEPVLDLWKQGALELWGRRGDPTAPPELIPTSAQKWLRWQFDHGTARVGRTVFYDARFWRITVKATPLASRQAVQKGHGGRHETWNWPDVAERLQKDAPTSFETRAELEEWCAKHVLRVNSKPRGDGPDPKTVKAAILRHGLDKIEGVTIQS